MRTLIFDDTNVASNIRILKAWIENKLSYDSQPAMNIGIVYDQELVWAESFGYADLENNRPAKLGDIYRIASQSKMFTAVALLKLVDDGKVRLDDQVVMHLPWYKMKNRFPGTSGITIRHLLTHTAGIPQEGAFPYWMDFKFPEIEQIIESLPRQETAYPSGTKWKYSNLGYVLAGEIIAVVSGIAYSEYIERNIFAPLGMTKTSVAISGKQKVLLTKGYGRRMPDGSRASMPFVELKSIAAAGGFSSTIEDLARFASWQFRLLGSGGTEIIKSCTLEDMHRVHCLNPDWESGWGMGFGITHKKERDIIGHGGWLPGYKTTFSMSLEEKVAVIVFQNTDDATPLVVDKAFEWVVPAIIKATAPQKSRNEPDSNWNKFIGKYSNWMCDRQIFHYNGSLVMIDPADADPKGSMFTLIPESENTFRLQGSGWGLHGELITFEFGPDGRVQKMDMGKVYMYPVK